MKKYSIKIKFFYLFCFYHLISFILKKPEFYVLYSEEKPKEFEWISLDIRNVIPLLFYPLILVPNKYNTEQLLYERDGYVKHLLIQSINFNIYRAS